MVLSAFRGIVGIRGNRDFVEIVGTVGFIVCAKIVETLETWKRPVPAPLSVSPSWLAPQSAPLAFPMRAQAALLFPVSFAAPRRRGACNAGLNKYAKKALPYPV